MHLCPFTVGRDFVLGNPFSGVVKLTKNTTDFDRCKYQGCGIGFNERGRIFLLSNGCGFGKNVIIYGADMSSLVDIDDKKKDILILGKDLTDGLDDTALTAEKEQSIYFTEQRNKFCLFALYG